jgi:hypothetical protein
MMKKITISVPEDQYESILDAICLAKGWNESFSSKETFALLVLEDSLLKLYIQCLIEAEAKQAFEQLKGSFSLENVEVD